jgi:hypothetical protein
MVLGTPLYMSPEQARGDEDLDHRVDIYALGIIMYEAASGRVPFSGNNYLSVIAQVLNEEPKSLREIRPDISEEFDAIVQKAIAKERGDRYKDATEMLADLNAVLDDPTHSTERARITGPRRFLPRPKIPRIAWAIGGAGIAVAVVTVVVTMLMGSKAKKRAAMQTPAVAIDAGVPVPAATPDAAVPVEPMVAKIKLTIVTDPPGADIYRESEPVGKAPVKLELAKNNDVVTIYAELPGGLAGTAKINPMDRTDGQKITIKLRKQSGASTIVRPKQPPKGNGAGSATQQGTPNATGGELGPNPFGTVPK